MRFQHKQHGLFLAATVVFVGMAWYVTVGDLNEAKVFRTENFAQVATILVGALPHGIWPSGDGLRVYVGLENGDAATAGVSNASPARTPAFSLNTPLNHIAADQRGKAVLERDLPGLMANRSYPLFDDMSLSQIAMMSGGRLSQTKLNLVRANLAQLSSSAGDGP